MQYQIEFDKQKDDVEYVYLDETTGQVKHLDTRPVGNNRVQADLAVEDPPIGKVG